MIGGVFCLSASDSVIMGGDYVRRVFGCIAVNHNPGNYFCCLHHEHGSLRNLVGEKKLINILNSINFFLLLHATDSDNSPSSSF